MNAVSSPALCVVRSGVRRCFWGTGSSGFFGGASFFFDFQKRPGRGDSSLISSTVTLGHSWDCCAVAAQFSSFNVGLRKENRVVFRLSFERNREPLGPSRSGNGPNDYHSLHTDDPYNGPAGNRP